MVTSRIATRMRLRRARIEFVSVWQVTTSPLSSCPTKQKAVCNAVYLGNAMHFTVSIFINDNESGLDADYEPWLEELAPFNAGTDPEQGAHHKRQIMGRAAVVAITDGKRHLGPWEPIFYYEFDARPRKRVLVKVIGE